MTSKLPVDFDAQWYRATYHDVALSGLGAEEHYRRFGRRLGRRVNGGSTERAVVTPDMHGLAAAEDESATANIASKPEVIDPQPFPIIDRPDDFEVTDTPTKPAPAPRAGSERERVSFATLLDAAVLAGERQDRIIEPLLAYGRALGLNVDRGPLDADRSHSCGATAFQEGEARVENAWHVGHSTLRLRLAGGTNAQSHNRWTLRAYQADPESPGELAVLGAGVELPALGPIFHDFELPNVLMPLLLELSKPDGSIHAMALMAFPSLLPGGLHWTELRACQVEANPMDDFWSRCEAFLEELIDLPGSPPRAISSLMVESGASEGAITNDLRKWLSAIFRLGCDAHETASRRFALEGCASGLELVLPAGSVPTISILVARDLDPGGSTMLNAPWLIADASTYGPRWSVLLPSFAKRSANIPIIRSRSGTAGCERVAPTVPRHAAILLRSTVRPLASEVVFPESRAQEKVQGLTVILDVSDRGWTAELVKAIQASTDALEFIVRRRTNEEMADPELSEIFSATAWSTATKDADLRSIAHEARHATLLTLSDQVRLCDPATLRTLCSLLESGDTIGSVSCALVGEAIVKRKVVAQPGVGGLFPSGVSFATAPNLSFFEPDVIDALPELTYPVVANTLSLSVFRKSALSKLAIPRGPVRSIASDVRLGLDLMRAGYGNWCTTRVTAGLRGPYARRDSIDPVGGRYLAGESWAQILSNVTLLRELV
jgi:hypothetical protein